MGVSPTVQAIMMHWRILVILLMMTNSLAFICPEPEICECAGNVVSCICDSRQNITLTLLLHLSVNRVYVHGCGTVTLPLGSMLHMNLDRIEFCDITRLNVRPFSLTGAEYIYSLYISDIADFDVMPLGFSSLHNVTSISIKNVTSAKLRKGAFGQISEVEEFIIEDSSFDFMEPLAFIFSNVSTLTISNTQIGTLSNASLLVHNAGTVSFSNCTIKETMESSFVVVFSDTLSFSNCTLGVMASKSILSNNLQTLIFQNSAIKKMESNALFDAHVIQSVKFLNNIFQLAERNSLFPNLTQDFRIEVRGNRFVCDCNLAWMWSENEWKYNELLLNSVCSGQKRKLLSSLVPRITSEGKCLGIDKGFLKNNFNYDEIGKKSLRVKLLVANASSDYNQPKSLFVLFIGYHVIVRLLVKSHVFFL